MLFINKRSKKKTYYDAYKKYVEMSNEKREFTRALLEADSKTIYAFSIIFSIGIAMFNSFDSTYLKDNKLVTPAILMILTCWSAFKVFKIGLHLEALKRVEKEKSSENHKKEP
ncbi:hypothetical protein [Sporomusa acidovorans]|uniref:YrhK domain-containing protein n=1 Tax=Sporomusa acidovorans (strain ATCC 49682 / DSM 3132 / Mol) TaxID=1123286 RepID=A0ABZ3J7B2_SPOA4|nr:hypothetical protein [Sporomusa acidovorans]OZC23797.1 hypothetical protein SPACI_04220 [Sporomusa acidovorans DSM 3132]SDF61493.1 hypothetical protein SAMN04488499_10632 [Sporomusa acidovorans]